MDQRGCLGQRAVALGQGIEDHAVLVERLADARRPRRRPARSARAGSGSTGRRARSSSVWLPVAANTSRWKAASAATWRSASVPASSIACRRAFRPRKPSSVMRSAARPVAAGSRRRRTSTTLRIESSCSRFYGQTQPVEQQPRLQARDVGAIPAADVEHPDQLQRLDRLAHRVARQAELRGELVLWGRREPGGRAPERMRSRICSMAASVSATTGSLSSDVWLPIARMSLRRRSCSPH